MKFVRTMLVSAVALVASVAASTSASFAADAELSKPWDQIVADAKSEGEVTFYAWWGEEFWKNAAKEFQDKYGIKVNVVIGDNTATVNKIVAETPNATGTVDAMLVGGVSLKLYLDAHSLLGPILPIIPDSDKLDAKLSKVQEGYATGGYLVPVYRNQVGFLYDPDKVPTPPQTWADFTAWLDAHPGQFAFNDPSKGGSGQAFVQAAIVNVLGGDQSGYAGATEADPAKIAEWTKVWDWFNANEDKFIITASNSDSGDRVNQGEALMAPQWDDDTAVAIAKGTIFKRAKLYIPEFGLPGGGDSLGIPANAPHKAAALLFISFLITPEAQIELNKTIGSYLARTDVSGESAILSEDERQKNGRPWLPGVYKGAFIEQFVSEVLQK
jgi:putative spermidine/putrescine transport system substrate-binding protein